MNAYLATSVCYPRRHRRQKWHQWFKKILSRVYNKTVENWLTLSSRQNSAYQSWDTMPLRSLHIKFFNNNSKIYGRTPYGIGHFLILTGDLDGNMCNFCCNNWCDHSLAWWVLNWSGSLWSVVATITNHPVGHYIRKNLIGYLALFPPDQGTFISNLYYPKKLWETLFLSPALCLLMA